MILVSGTIGAGKTSLTRILARHLHAHPYYEPVKNNPVLPLFYKGNQLVANHQWKTNPYVFILQIYFLNIRYHMIKRGMQDNLSIMDRSIYEDRLFAHMNYALGNATKPEWKIYKSLLLNMLRSLPYLPQKHGNDLMIYIKMDYPTMIKHIEARGRAYEQPKTNPSLKKYYRTLLKYYDQWSHNYRHSPILTIDGTKFDFVNNRYDRQIVLEHIDAKLKKLNIIK